MESAGTNGLVAVIMILILVGFFFAVRGLLLFLMKRDRKVLSLIVILCTAMIMFIGFFAYVSASAKMSKERDKLYREVASKPCDASVDELMRFIERRGCINTPQSWNQLRAVWIAVNNSPYVTTQKKNELKNYLMLKGLNMHYNDAKVKDNYGR